MTSPTRHATLLSPVRIGPVTAPTRVVSTSHQTSLVRDHLPAEELIAYHRARARGGVGAIFLEAAAIDPGGVLTGDTVGGFLPEIVPVYRRLAEALHEHGTRLFVQLLHAGREQFSSSPRTATVAPSAVPSLRFKTEPRALSTAEIAALVDGYALAGQRAAEGGVDGIEVTMAHGYLPAQFLSPIANRRDDAYGGSFEGRLRFAREVLGAVRERVGPSLAVGARLSADELTPGGVGTDGCARIASALHADGLVDFVSLALGNSAYPSASTWVVPPAPVASSAIAAPARAVRERAPELTIIATTRVVDLDDAEQLVAEGTADLVGMTRALIADPELVAKAATDRLHEVIECLGCNQACIGHRNTGKPISCVVNPRSGRELAMPPIARRAQARRVLVIGAGPAGVAAAIEAASAGDEVRIVERAETIGGQLRIAGLAHAHRELWERYERSTLARLRAAGVTVEHGVEADAALAAEHELVVLASGARPYRPPLPPELPYAVLDAWTAVREPALATGAVLVADWGGGWDGLDAAEQLARAGAEVALACAATLPGETLHGYQRNLYLGRLHELGVVIVERTELALDGPAPLLRHVFSGCTDPLPEIDTLVVAAGRCPSDELWSELQDHPGALRAGDVLGARSMEEAVLEGTLAVGPATAQTPSLQEAV